jgi:hypothetical protein
MTVPSNPLPQLLDRELARAKAREIVGDLLETTEDMANEGTQLLGRLLSEAARVNPRRRFNSSLLLLLRHVIEHIDAVDELFKAGIFSPTSLHVRSILEARMQMLYMAGQRAEFRPSPLDPAQRNIDPVPRDADGAALIGPALEAERERRGAAYIVADIRAQLAQAERYTTANVHDWLERMTGDASGPALVSDPSTQSQLQAEIVKLKNQLAEPENQPLDAAIAAARGRDKFDPPWYEIDGGPGSVRALAASVGLVGDYDMFYSPASVVMHAANVRGQLGTARDTGGHGPAPLRHAHFGAEVARTLIIHVVQIYRHVISELRPSDMAMWSEWTKRWTVVARAIE